MKRLLSGMMALALTVFCSGMKVTAYQDSLELRSHGRLLVSLYAPVLR